MFQDVVVNIDADAASAVAVDDDGISDVIRKSFYRLFGYTKCQMNDKLMFKTFAVIN